jgi:hypothetical protein
LGSVIPREGVESHRELLLTKADEIMVRDIERGIESKCNTAMRLKALSHERPESGVKGHDLFYEFAKKRKKRKKRHQRKTEELSREES